MELKVQVNDVEIMKHLINGLSPKDIAERLRPGIFEYIKPKIQEQVIKELKRVGLAPINKAVAKQLPILYKEYVSAAIRSELKNGLDIEDLLSEVMAGVLADKLEGNTLKVTL